MCDTACYSGCNTTCYMCVCRTEEVTKKDEEKPACPPVTGKENYSVAAVFGSLWSFYHMPKTRCVIATQSWQDVHFATYIFCSSWALLLRCVQLLVQCWFDLKEHACLVTALLSFQCLPRNTWKWREWWNSTVNIVPSPEKYFKRQWNEHGNSSHSNFTTVKYATQ